VQKSCALTNHIWDGFWFIANGRAYGSLPPDLQRIVSTAINEAGVKQRGDIKALNEGIQKDLQAKGLVFTQPAADSFRAKLRASGFYGDWKSRFGADAWSHLETAVGQLA
jgi:TRAP-type C4-dicarboxylate transport system substrate-binding protein